MFATPTAEDKKKPRMNSLIAVTTDVTLLLAKHLIISWAAVATGTILVKKHTPEVRGVISRTTPLPRIRRYNRTGGINSRRIVMWRIVSDIIGTIRPGKRQRTC
jgi:hypothetical protein